MERNCDNCVYATRSGGCASWECDYIPIREAAAAWKREQEAVEMLIALKEMSEGEESV